MKPTKRSSELKTIGLALAVIWVLVILYLSFAPPQSLPSIPVGGNHSDKWAHFAMYFILTIAFCYAIPNTKRTFKNVYIACSLAIVFGIIVEVMQNVLTDYRSGDLDDVLANMLGALLGMLVFLPVRKR